MKIYTYTEARQNLSLVLDQTQQEGYVQIKRRNGRKYLITPLIENGTSPLDIPGIDCDIETDDIVSIIRTFRKREI